MVVGHLALGARRRCCARRDFEPVEQWGDPFAVHVASARRGLTCRADGHAARAEALDRAGRRPRRPAQVHRLGHRDRARLQRGRRRARPRGAPRRAGRVPVHARRSTRTCTAAASGRCASTRATPRAKETNERFHYLIKHGSTGLSMAFDLPTQLGRDSDDPLCEGEVGRTGVAIDTIDDMRRVFDGIPLDEVSTSMTINAPASRAAAPLRARRRGAGRRVARSCAAPPRTTSSRSTSRAGTSSTRPCPAMRLTTDLFAYCRERVPKWNTISISGYHMREKGCSAVQEVGFTLANAIAYVQAAIDAGLERRRVRPAARLLLQRPQQRLPGGRQVPRRAPDVGADHARAVRLREPQVADDPLPHPDRRRHAGRAAAGEQHRARGAPGLRRGLRRHAVAAHERLRRGARAADREGGADRAAHPADPRPRVRRRRHASTRSRARTSSRASPTRSRRARRS